MKQSTFDAVKVLSQADQKDLSDRVLKTMEELGELAKKALPYANAFATNHRITTPNGILEEVADGMLCLLSIAYQLNFSDEDIDSMLVAKMQKWSDLQTRDLDAKWPVPFEIHITVKEGDVDRFREVCSGLGAKPLLLHLQTESHGIIPDLMTSSIKMGRNSDAMDEIVRISDGLTRAGFEVIRKKIEAAPWHPMAPTESGSDMPKDCYFESHLGVKVRDRAPLEEFVRQWNSETDQSLRTLGSKLKISRNAFKIKDGEQTIMLTYRNYKTIRTVFEVTVAMIARELKQAGFNVEKTIIEFSIYDSRESHDAAWIR